MNLLTDPWIPVRPDGGTGPLQLLTYRQLLCAPDPGWRIALPRDDLELACLQLLVSMTQVLFLPADRYEVEDRLASPLAPDDFDAGIAPCADWFVLDHPTQPFMQTRGVSAKEPTPIQKLLIGLPEGNNHCLFNQVGEVRALSAPLAAIALFHQATNCPSFGGGFKGSLRGGAPITTLVDADGLRRQVWSNVIGRDLLRQRMPFWRHDLSRDRPTWIDPIPANATLHPHQIGLARGLFWQPAHVELIPATEPGPCDLLGIPAGPRYSGLRKEKFNFTLEGLWPHPHGPRKFVKKGGKLEEKFSSFTTSAPGWTLLTEFVVAAEVEKGAGSEPAAPVAQARALEIAPLHLLVGGYRNNQAAIEERRHELFCLGAGWQRHEQYLAEVVALGLKAKTALRGKLFFAVKGHKDKKLEGLAAPLYELAEQRFYARSEGLIRAAIADPDTYADWPGARTRLTQALGRECRDIFTELTDPFMAKPELIPIIAWARRSLYNELKQLEEGK